MNMPEVTLGALEGGKGNFVDGPFGSNLKSSEYKEFGVPLIQLKNIKPNKYLPKNLKFVSQEKADSISRHTYQAGDITIAKLGAVGTACIIPNGNPNGIVVADVCRFRGDKSQVDYKYLCYFLNSPEGQRRVLEYSKGTTRLRTNLTDLKKVKVPLPPIKTQKQIAAVLEKADQLRNDCQQMGQELNSLAQSVFIDMFGDPIANPNKWEIRTLKEFYASEKTGTKCGPFGSALKKDEFVDSGIPVWNMSNITLQGKFVDGASLWITQAKYEELEAYGVEQGDVIISRAGTVGKMGVVNSEHDTSIISTNLIRVRFSEELHPLYFVCLMTYFKTRLKRLKVGDDGSFSHMNTGILDNLEFPYPPKDTQLRYIEFRDKLDQQFDQLNKLKSAYNEQFNALMQKAFKGELNLDKSST